MEDLVAQSAGDLYDRDFYAWTQPVCFTGDVEAHRFRISASLRAGARI